MQSQKIICPKCGTEIELSEAISKQYRAELEKEIEGKYVEEKAQLKQKTEKEIAEQFQLEMQDLKAQLLEKDGKIKKASEDELALRKRVREVEEKEQSLNLEIERGIAQEKEKLLGEQRLKDLEKDKAINDLKEQIGDLKRKAEQGSMQAQGEIMELDLEDMLRTKFPNDEIIAVPKGVEGADIIHKVNYSNNYCGTIIWEFKNTKNWSDKWVNKLKDDQREKKAEIAVIVSRAIPASVKNCCNLSGIWVCSYPFSMEFSDIIRANLVAVAIAKNSQVGKEEKMDAIYDYLTSNIFKQRIEAIVEAFVSMKEGLEKEKVSMQKNWSTREMQIGRVIKNTVGMYGDMQGIIGATLPKIDYLELEDKEIEEIKGITNNSVE
ncbi:MAG: DUF2130 domain-containing protein [Actinobacteria bacterium]|nr:DUF2130 domain-containing protein [Actinomycetota bacterium]